MPSTPVAGEEQTPDKQLFATGVAMLPKSQNYAKDKDVRNFIDQWLYPQVKNVRRRRRPLEDEWMAIRRMLFLVPDEGKRYNGRSNAYLPVYARTMNTRVAGLSKGLFPSDEYMDCYDRGQGDTEQSRALKAYMQWEMENNAKIRSILKPFLREFDGYGNGVLKFWYGQQLPTKQVKRAAIHGALFDGMDSQPDAYCEGARCSARSIFNVYVYPETAETAAEASLIFEDEDVSRNYCDRMAATGEWENVEEAMQSHGDAEVDWHRQRLMADAASMTDTKNQNQGNPVSEVYTLTECWTYMVLPRSAYAANEDPSLPLSVRVLLLGNTPLSVRRNPYYHQSPPYLFGRQEVNPGFFYGSGTGRAVRSLQYLANDFANQSNDVGIYGLNPIIKMNPAYMIGVPPPMRPGGVFKMTDIDKGMTFDRPPVDLVQWGQQLLGQYVGMVQDFAGAPPVLQGQGAGKGAKTATGAQILQRNALAPLQDLVEDLENDVLVPLMRGIWRNAMQFRNDDVMVRVMGRPLRVTPEDLAIEAEFRWMASSQAANRQQMSQQVLGFIQALMPALPVMNQLGYIVDPVPLFRRVFNDGFGFRGFDQVVQKQPQMGVPPQDMPPGAMPPGGMPPGAMPPGNPAMPQDGDRVRSTLEQLGGVAGAMGQGQNDMVPGEGDDFMDIRSQADELAALEAGRGGGN